MTAKVFFRAGVVIVVRHPEDQRVMAFERHDSSGQWQLPQGGIEAEETALQAAYRELIEETGLTRADVVLVGEHPEWLAYEWPDSVKAGRKGSVDRSKSGGGRDRVLGQVHRWFYFEALDAQVIPAPDQREFRDWRWVPADWLVDNVIEMRRAAYAKALGG